MIKLNFIIRNTFVAHNGPFLHLTSKRKTCYKVSLLNLHLLLTNTYFSDQDQSFLTNRKLINNLNPAHPVT